MTEDASTQPLTLPGFAVHHLLGGGAAGQVWLAREERSGDLVALKRLRPGTPTDGERLLREASLLAAFRHDHVIRLRSVELTADGLPVLVLDHAAGGSLAALLGRRGRLEPGEVVTVAAPLARALAEAHARGLVHGDVTPANVLFDAGGKPLLADLGVGRLLGEPRAVEGTADYLDPAVASGASPGPAADVHALAAVCHHMLTGRPPYAGDSLADVLRAASVGERVSLAVLAPDAPPGLVDAVESALTADPARRPAAADLADAILAAAPARPVLLRGGGDRHGAGHSRADPDVRTTTSTGVSPSRRWTRRSRSSPSPNGGAAPDGSAAQGAAGQEPALTARALLASAVPPATPAGPRPTHAVPSRLRTRTPSLEEPSTWLRALRERVGDAGRSAVGRVALAGALVLLVLLAGYAVTTEGPDAARRDVAPLAVAAEPGSQPLQPAVEEQAGPSAGEEAEAAADEPAEGLDVAGADGATSRVASPGPSGSPTAGDGGAEDDEGTVPGGIWGEVVDRLDAARADALAAADPARLAEVYVEGSAALDADRAVVTELGRAGLSVRGARHELREVTVLSEEPGRVRLLVVDVLPAHEVLGPAGEPVEHRPGRGPAPVQLDLVQPVPADGGEVARDEAAGDGAPGDGADGGAAGGDGWRISAVTRP